MSKRLKRKTGLGLFLTLWLCLVTAADVFGAQKAGNEIQQVELMDYVENVYDESNGMPASEANTILQDRQGFIWIGSYGGLCRYNSHEFENLSLQRESAPQSGIRVLLEDSQGRIWIGTNDSGVYLFDRERFSYLEETANLSIRAIEEGPDHSVYIGTTNGLLKVDSEMKTEEVCPEYLDGDTVNSIACGDDGRLWGVAAKSQLFAMKDGAMELFLGRDFFGYDLEESIFPAKDGTVYVGTAENRLLRLTLRDGICDSAHLKTTILSTGSKECINDIYEDTQGRIWVCTDFGMGYFEKGDVFCEVLGFSGDTIISEMFEDYEGNLWFSSTRRGVFELTKSKFKNVNYVAGASDQTVNATILYKKSLYIGMDLGLSIMDENGKKVENELTRLLSGIRIRNLMVDNSGILWISTYKNYGLIAYDSATGWWKSFTEKDGMPHNQVRMCCQLKNGDIAVATNGGIAILRDYEVIKTYRAKDGIQNETILCLAEGEDGRLFAGSDGNGIYELYPETGKVRNVTTEDGLSSGVILRMAPDEAVQGIWISNGSSLSLWQQDGIHKIPAVETGAGSVFDIRLTKEYVWLVKSSGLIRITREDLINGVKNWETFTRKDGLMSGVTANSWNYLGPAGLMFLCTGNGIFYININEIYQNTSAPKIAVGSIEADEEIYYGARDIALSASNQRITIHVDLLSYGFADGKLEYYLEGFDKDWKQIQSRSDNQISYTNLAGGTYTFHLKGINADGTESGELTFQIQKERSFFEEQYLRIWLGMGAGLLALLAIVIIQYGNRKRILKRQREYQSMLDQVIRIISKTIDAKDKYTIGHSNRVAVYSEEIGRRFGLSKEELERLHYTALLHDIGKIGIPDEILNKRGKLTDEEYETIKKHPSIGGEILKDFTIAPWIGEGARYHHERYDGKGYNEGLKGEEIPLFARIISVADSYDSMNSTRSYRVHLTKEVIREELKKGLGTQFDEKFVKIMLEMIDEGFEAS